MKNLIKTAIVVTALTVMASVSFATNHVSEMATTKGGQCVSKCAKSMERGVSSCALMPDCSSMGCCLDLE